MSMAHPRYRRSSRNIATNHRPKGSPFVEPLESRKLFSTDVLTYHNDASSTGQNLTESVLTTANVNASQFGLKFSTPIIGQIYAQPLYKSDVNITAGAQQGVHNVVYVVTQHDLIYALDANTGIQLWRQRLFARSAGESPVPAHDMSENLVTPEVGITGTPVIDPTTNTLYLTAKTKGLLNGTPVYTDRLYAINISDGSRHNVIVGRTTFDGSNYGFISGPTVNGTGDGSVNGTVTFNALREMNRTAMSLVNGVLYFSYASPDDISPYHGWTFGFSAQSLQLVAAFNTTPNGGDGGIWQSGGRITSDELGNLYVVTGNGTFDTTLNAQGFPINGDYGDSVLKLAPDTNSSAGNQNANGWGLKVVDYFTPHDQALLNSTDTDLGSGGVLLLPRAAGSAAHRRLLVTVGKSGTIYVMGRNSLGRFDPSTDHVVQELPGVVSAMFGSAAYFNKTIYLAGTGSDPLVALPISNATINTSGIVRTPDSFGFSSSPVISANGSADAILWALSRVGSQLRAYDASNVGSELFTADLSHATKFSVPTVADGMVYVGTETGLSAFGLL